MPHTQRGEGRGGVEGGQRGGEGQRDKFISTLAGLMALAANHRPAAAAKEREGGGRESPTSLREINKNSPIGRGRGAGAWLGQWRRPPREMYK